VVAPPHRPTNHRRNPLCRRRFLGRNGEHSKCSSGERRERTDKRKRGERKKKKNERKWVSKPLYTPLLTRPKNRTDPVQNQAQHARPILLLPFIFCTPHNTVAPPFFFCIHSFLFLFFAIFYRIHLLSCIFIFYHTLFCNISYWFSSVFFAFLFLF